MLKNDNITFTVRLTNLTFVYIIGLIIFTIFRAAYFIRFISKHISFYDATDIARAFLKGILFDTVVLCYLLVLPLILITLSYLFKNRKFRIIIDKTIKHYIIVALSLFVLILFTDQQYYTYFQTHINILAFGFIEDDTNAVLTSIWTDHPVLIITSLFIVFIISIRKSIYYAFAKKYSYQLFNNQIFRFTYILIFLLLFGIGLRGSLGVFPLRKDDIAVSSNQVINQLVSNGVFSLFQAVKEKTSEAKLLNSSEILNNCGKNSVNELISDFYDLPTDSVTRNYTDYLFKTTKKNDYIEQNQPNVVMVLMESFGSYYLKFHNKNLNLLGELENHLYSDYLFLNFISATRGTIFSLESLLINTAGSMPISGTEKRFLKYESSFAYPYKQAGYETFFITTGKIGWRNLCDLIPNLYFDEYIDEKTLIAKYPQAERGTWGVMDEFMYDYIYNELNEKSEKPKLFFVLTTSNHTPYEIPTNYKPFPINISDSLYNIFVSNKDVAKKNFIAYQYSNHCLGNFLSRIKRSHLVDNTLVAATGDHPSYSLFPYSSNNYEAIYKHSVPFYLYVPKKYQPLQAPDLSLFASHKDIFPTIVNVSLSNAKYFTTGNNLLVTDTKTTYFGDNLSYQIAKQGIDSSFIAKKATARRNLLNYYFAEKFSEKNQKTP